MAVMQRPVPENLGAPRPVLGYESHRLVLDERDRCDTTPVLDLAARGVASIAAGIGVVMATTALMRLDRSVGIEVAHVDVAGVTFTPVVAVVTLLAMLAALGVAASPWRNAKVAAGAVLATVGVVLLLGGEGGGDLQLGLAHGRLALGVGIVLTAAGLLTRDWWHVRAAGNDELEVQP